MGGSGVQHFAHCRVRTGYRIQREGDAGVAHRCHLHRICPFPARRPYLLRLLLHRGAAARHLLVDCQTTARTQHQAFRKVQSLHPRFQMVFPGVLHRSAFRIRHRPRLVLSGAAGRHRALHRPFLVQFLSCWNGSRCMQPHQPYETHEEHGRLRFLLLVLSSLPYAEQEDYGAEKRRSHQLQRLHLLR